MWSHEAVTSFSPSLQGLEGGREGEGGIEGEGRGRGREGEGRERGGREGEGEGREREKGREGGRGEKGDRETGTGGEKERNRKAFKKIREEAKEGEGREGEGEGMEGKSCYCVYQQSRDHVTSLVLHVGTSFACTVNSTHMIVSKR